MLGEERYVRRAMQTCHVAGVSFEWTRFRRVPPRAGLFLPRLASPRLAACRAPRGEARWVLGGIFPRARRDERRRRRRYGMVIVDKYRAARRHTKIPPSLFSRTRAPGRAMRPRVLQVPRGSRGDNSDLRALW